MTLGSNVVATTQPVKRQTRNAAGGLPAQYRNTQHWGNAAGPRNYPSVQTQPWKGAAGTNVGANAANPPKPSAIRPLFKNAAGDTATPATPAADNDSMTKAIAMSAFWFILGALAWHLYLKYKKK